MIAGIDPGFTTAYAILNIDGKILKIKSKKEFGFKRLIKEISFYKPFIIACDVIPAPALVSKIASSMNAIIIGPKKRIGMKKKKEIVKEFAKKIKKTNRHETTAVAAAILAYKHFSPLLNKIKSIKIEKEKKQILFKMLVTKKYKNIASALREI